MLLWVLIVALFGAMAAFFGGGLPPTLKARVLAVQAAIAVAFSKDAPIFRYTEKSRTLSHPPTTALPFCTNTCRLAGSANATPMTETVKIVATG